MGRKHSYDDILAGAVECVTANGLSQLSFGKVAKHLGISDRTVVYYFPTKDDLATAVMLAIGGSLQGVLGDAFASAPDHLAMTTQAWPLLTTKPATDVFRIFFEANGLAAAGQQPYDQLVPQLVAAWTDWLMDFFPGSAAERRREAEATIALVDGLILLRLLRGPAAANRAATAIGVR